LKTPNLEEKELIRSLTSPWKQLCGPE
jgi:hypothetical protein